MSAGLAHDMVVTDSGSVFAIGDGRYYQTGRDSINLQYILIYVQWSCVIASRILHDIFLLEGEYCYYTNPLSVYSYSIDCSVYSYSIDCSVYSYSIDCSVYVIMYV